MFLDSRPAERFPRNPALRSGKPAYSPLSWDNTGMRSAVQLYAAHCGCLHCVMRQFKLAELPGVFVRSDDQLTGLLARLQDADDRIVMGLPQQVVDRLPVESRGYVADLVGMSPEVLAGMVEDASQSRPRRFFSGQLLALLGDPRITPDMPVMVDIPAATVHVGLDPRSVDSVLHRRAPHGLQRDWLLAECPRHRVYVQAFRMMRYPVTNCEYHRFLADTEYSVLPTSWRFGRYPHELANHPVWSVDEAAAGVYASWLSARLGRRFRLPTEAEWEYAASGGDDREYPWGNEFNSDAANTVEAGPLSTTPVGMYPAGRSPLGVDDLAGNVEELVCGDYVPDPGGIGVNDDVAVGRRAYRVTRGGSFTRFSDLAHCRRRHCWYAPHRLYATGFRLVESDK
jgi:toxoflavin biosynthesis protein ToxD